MHLIDRYGRCSIDLEYLIDDSSDYDSFSFSASIDIGHGLFKAANNDIHFLNLPTFVAQLESFVRDRMPQPRLDGTYNSYLELSGTPSSATIHFRIGDAFSGYTDVNTQYSFTGAFDVEPDQLFPMLDQFRGLLESWRRLNPT